MGVSSAPAWRGNYDPDRKISCGHLLVTIDIARMMPQDEFESRLVRLIEQVNSVPKASGVGAISFPG